MHKLTPSNESAVSVINPNEQTAFELVKRYWKLSWARSAGPFYYRCDGELGFRLPYRRDTMRIIVALPDADEMPGTAPSLCGIFGCAFLHFGRKRVLVSRPFRYASHQRLQAHR